MTIKGDEQNFYVCGRCDTKIFYLVSEGIESQVPCPDCGWYGKERRYKDVPSEIKIDLTQY